MLFQQVMHLCIYFWCSIL